MTYKIIPPGGVIGILGSGQLGRMITIAARRLGYRVHTYSPESASPTGQVADCEIVGSYDDIGAVRMFARDVDVMTLEFENVSSEAVRAAETVTCARPNSRALYVTQNRVREKTFLRDSGFPTAAFCAMTSADGLRAAVSEIGFPGVLKVADSGYDGKGQRIIRAESDIVPAWRELNCRSAICEAFVDFSAEASVVLARGADGACAHFGLFENIHRDHILDVTLAPGRFSPALAIEATALAERIAAALEYVGTLCVEFFVTKDQGLLVNEIAPRAHNSGHVTIDSHVTDQFEQCVRAVCGLPLAAVTQHRPAAMVNLLGDIWFTESGARREPDWSAALVVPNVKLHLYGKTEPRRGRKMGHITTLGDTVELARDKAFASRSALMKG